MASSSLDKEAAAARNAARHAKAVAGYAAEMAANHNTAENRNNARHKAALANYAAEFARNKTARAAEAEKNRRLRALEAADKTKTARAAQKAVEENATATSTLQGTVSGLQADVTELKKPGGLDLRVVELEADVKFIRAELLNQLRRIRAIEDQL